MRTTRKYGQVVLLTIAMVGAAHSHWAAATLSRSSLEQKRPTGTSLTPLQLEIEKQRARLSSSEAEERRDALMQLGSMHNPDASRVALAALGDPMAIVKVSAAEAILSLPPDECARSLIPLLGDENEFVRRETAFALGKTSSRMAVAPLTERLLNDKLDSVRGAAAVALGQIRDETAVASLAGVLNPQSVLVPSKRSQKKKKPENAFVLRAAARALGQIGSRAGVPALIGALQDEHGEPDVRRESARALGAVGDSRALPALRVALTALDPYLSRAAQEAIDHIVRL
jgi:HEAT repeat protein